MEVKIRVKKFGLERQIAIATSVVTVGIFTIIRRRLKCFHATVMVVIVSMLIVGGVFRMSKLAKKSIVLMERRIWLMERISMVKKKEPFVSVCRKCKHPKVENCLDCEPYRLEQEELTRQIEATTNELVQVLEALA